MKTFFKDYVELQKESFRFIKKHPVGIIVSIVISGLVGYGVPTIVYKVKERAEYNEYIKKISKHEDEA